MATIVRQIEEIENNIKSYEDQLDGIERSLRLKKMPANERENLEDEQTQLREKIKEHEKQLGCLRKENRKNTFVSVAILGLLYLVYVLFSNIIGSSTVPQEKTEL